MKKATTQKIQQLRQMYVAAQQARQAGLNLQAENLYRDILKEAPGLWDVQQEFALLLAATGRVEEAVKHFRVIVKAHPTYPSGHANLANALSESGQYKESITEFKRTLTLDPSLIGARIAFAETLRRAASYDLAIQEYRFVLDHDKTNHAAFNGMGLAYRDMQDWPRALECFEHAVGLAPSNADYRLNFGAALRDYNLSDLSAQQFYEAVKLRPTSIEAIVLLAEILQNQRRFDEAKKCYDRALLLEPGQPELKERLGYVYLDMGDTERARESFSEVLSTYPSRFMAMLGLGRSHMEAGRNKEAAATLESVISEHPENIAGYHYLAGSRKFKPDDPIIPALHKLADKTADEESAAITLNFALGKIYDDTQQWDTAWRHYSRANRLRNAQYDYQPEVQEKLYDELIRVFSRSFIEEHGHLGIDSRLPVFIVGMPRSGTTLTEQIISSHPGVIGAGEIRFWREAYRALPYKLSSATSYPACMAEMNVNHAQEIAETYLSTLRKIVGPGTDPARITDKMPHNFVQLGLISLLLPHAPIIHCKRAPMDNCLSIFFQNFGGVHPYAYDLVNLGHHHKQYERLMEHWHQVLPGRILDLNYEDTIADPEFWSRKLIEHVGLEWDDACLAPHKLERTVKTASHWQVRQPIYKTSVQRWKYYEKYLDPLKISLGYQN